MTGDAKVPGVGALRDALRHPFLATGVGRHSWRQPYEDERVIAVNMLLTALRAMPIEQRLEMVGIAYEQVSPLGVRLFDDPLGSDEGTERG